MRRIQRVLKSAPWLLLIVICYVVPLGIYLAAKYEDQQKGLRKLKRSVERERVQLTEIDAAKRLQDAFKEEIAKLDLDLEKFHQYPRLKPDPPFDGHTDKLLKWAREMAVAVRLLDESGTLSSDLFDSKWIEFTAAGDRQAVNDFLSHVESEFPHARVVYLELHQYRPRESSARVIVEVFFRSELEDDTPAEGSPSQHRSLADHTPHRPPRAPDRAVVHMAEAGVSSSEEIPHRLHRGSCEIARLLATVLNEPNHIAFLSSWGLRLEPVELIRAKI